MEQQALSAAAQTVAASVVQIHAVGGLEQVEGTVASQGPSTGLIVTSDGYIVSSAYNFAQRPSSILVRLPDGEQRPAEIIGRDASRMLVLLKVNADRPLPVATAAPIAECRVGDWAVAVGRTYQADEVNVSVGIVSALGRMHGRVMQTDANVSTANYGGPLVDIQGRTLGVLVPMAPPTPGTETSDVAGAEYYDSGIGFAVPLQDVLNVLPRWMKEKDLKRGLLGIGMTPGSAHSTPPTITAVWPSSPAAEADWQKGDLIVSVDGQPVASQTELRFRVVPRYAGDKLKVTLRRGQSDDAEDIETEVTLAAELQPYRHAFLGVLPQRAESHDAQDAEAAGVAIRAVWPDSAAAEAGLQRGDRITHLGDKKIESLDDALAELNARSPGDTLTIQAVRGELNTKQNIDEEVELTALPIEPLSSADLPAPANSESDDDADADDAADATPELTELRLPEFPQAAWYSQPPADGPPPGLLVWLADGKKETAETIAAAWKSAANRDGLTILFPTPGDKSGWTPDDVEYLGRLLPTAARRLGVDPLRVVVAGQGKSGQLAYALAFEDRKWVRGVVAIDAPLPRTLELPPTSPNERLAVLSIQSQGSPLAPIIRQDLGKLDAAGYPAGRIIRRDASDNPRDLDALTRAKIARWIDGLDRF